MKKLNNNQAGFGAIESLLIVVVVVILGIVGYMVYKNHNKNTVKPLSANTVPILQPTQAVATKKPAPSSDSTTVVIKELGISFTGPNTLEDLTYTYRTSKTDDGKTIWIADLSSKSLTSFDKNCASDGIAPPLGALAKVDGQYPAEPTETNSANPLIKQFSTYYIGGPGKPQASCSDKDYPQDLQAKTTQLKSDLTEALAAIKTL